MGNLIKQVCKSCKQPLKKWTKLNNEKGIACPNTGCPEYAILIKRKRGKSDS